MRVQPLRLDRSYPPPCPCLAGRLLLPTAPGGGCVFRAPLPAPAAGSRHHPSPPRYSSRVEVPPDQLFARPAELDEKAAAGFPCVAITAWYAAVYLAAVREGTAVVVHSAAGGVGSMLVQICVAKGCRVLAVVGASHKVDACTAMGAHAVIDKSKGGDLWAEAKAFSPRGFHAIFDANGTETLRGGCVAAAPTCCRYCSSSSCCCAYCARPAATTCTTTAAATTAAAAG